MSIKDAFWDYLVGQTTITDLVDLRVYQIVSPMYATGLLTVTVLPSDDETVSIDDKTYTWKDTLGSTDGHVKIVANIDASLDNMVKAVNLSGVAGTDYGTPTTLHATVSASRPLAGKLEAMAKKESQAGDLDTTETMANGSWGKTNLNLYPVVTLHRIDAEHIRTMDGGAGLAQAKFQVDCRALDSVDAEAVADAIFTVCQGKDATTIGTPEVTIESMTAEVVQDLYEPPEDDDDAGLFRQMMSISIWHRESVPSP